jgi:hypothetical protein
MPIDCHVDYLTFPRNKNAALPVRARKGPLTISGRKKMGPEWRFRPRAFAPQASVMASNVRDDVGHEYTCFMRRGEDARLHGRFLSTRGSTPASSNASRCRSVVCRSVSLGCKLHLAKALIGIMKWHSVYEMSLSRLSCKCIQGLANRELWQKRWRPRCLLALEARQA